MLDSRKTLIKISAALLAVTAASGAASLTADTSLLAQSPSPTSFPLPSSLPSGTTVKLDGSSSMALVNEALKQRFEQQFSGSTVSLAANGTGAALKALVNGDIDLAAIGRPLTDEEKAQGLTETTINREKIAIIIGPENPYQGDLTFDQFAKIFRGEITDWSEVGGAAGPIRLIDRPDDSDTRLSLSKYKAFTVAPFQTGATATQVSQDDTAAVVNELGRDGISYAVVSQVIDQPTVVTIVPMHKTLPDDPRYPYSQPRGYVYKGNPTPGVLAFLGFAASPAGQEAVQSALAGASAVGLASAGSPPSPSPAASPGSLSPTASPEVVSPGAVSPGALSPGAVSPGAAEVSPSTAVAPPAEPAAADPGGLPGWLGWLLLPLIAGGLWWLAKGRGGAAPSAGVAPVPPVPVPPAPVLPTPVPPVVPAAAPPAVSPVGGVGAPAGGVAPVGGVAAPLAAAGAAIAGRKPDSRPDSRIVLTPRTSEAAYAYWEAPEAGKAALRDQGGQKMAVRVMDATDIDLDHQPPHSTQQFDCEETATDLHVPIPQSDRDYVAEVGYLTADHQWLKLARSAAVRVPSGLNLQGLAAGGAALAAGGAALAAVAQSKPSVEPLLNPATVVDDSRIILTPRTSDSVYAYWEAPEASKVALQEQGGAKFQLRLYDATHIDMDVQPAHSVQIIDLDGMATDQHVSIPMGDRDYVAEVGYETGAGRWLKLARSSAVRAPAVMNTGDMGAGGISSGGIDAGALGLGALGVGAIGLSAAGLGSDLGVAAPAVADRCSVKTLHVHSQRNCFLINPDQKNYLQSEVAVSKVLEPGAYILRIKEGGFGYRSDDLTSEPVVLLWIYGGKVVNQKTNVLVQATWSTLNGLDEVLNLEVLETATLCAFFFDTNLEDNQGEVTLSVVRL